MVSGKTSRARSSPPAEEDGLGFWPRESASASSIASSDSDSSDETSIGASLRV